MGSSGYATQTVNWETGIRRWTAELLVVRSDSAVPGTRSSVGGDTDAERTGDDVAARLRELDSSLRLVPRNYPTASTTSAGVEFAGWAILPFGVAFLLGVVLLIAGPEPWRATRWAWLWLAMLPAGPLAFFLLSGSTPGLPRPTAPWRRLTGGKAFLLTVVIGSLLTMGLAQLAAGIWPPHG